MTDTGKTIYNLYLRALRVNNNKPYRPRQNFDDFDKKEEYFHVLRLEEMFKKYPHLLRYEFFDAPYKLHSNDETNYYTLKYFASYKGLKTCVEYFKSMQKTDPDQQLDYIKSSLRFIADFCLEKEITVGEYMFYKSVSQNDFLKHLKEHKISWYMIFGIPSMVDFIYKMDTDEFELYFGDDVNLGDLQYRFNNSQRAKKMIQIGMKKIKDFVANSLKSSGKSGIL